jgi:sulfatase maturation enzyme AslB (radical SAM superfamily)
MMEKPLPSTFCIIPWMHRHTDEQGYHKLCCIADGDGNALKDAQGQLLHVSGKLTDADVLNSPIARATRVAMMGNRWPAACLRCEQAEDAGAESGRQYLNQRFDHGTSEALLAATSADGTLADPVVRYADIRLGNVCNLTCRMCTPVASRLWVPHFNQTQPLAYRIGEADLQVLGQNNWVKQEPVQWLLEQSLPHLEGLHFAGGEPLLLPELVEALQQCVDSGRAGEIELSFNTNMTVLPEKVTRLWHHFKSVSILCSIDGYGRVTEYIRRPSKWADLDRNLRKLDENFEAWNIKWATVTCTTQISNILTLDKLFAYLREAKFLHITRIPQLMPLFYPNYLSIQGLPPAAKVVAREKLEKEIAVAEALDISGLSGLIGSIRATLQFMDDADTTSNLTDFHFFTEASDRAFGDDWREATPELAGFLDSFAVPKRGLGRLIQLLGN